MPDIAASFSFAAPFFSVVLGKRVPADRTGPIANSLTSGIAVGDCIAKGTSDLTPRLRAPLVPLNRRKKP